MEVSAMKDKNITEAFNEVTWRALSHLKQEVAVPQESVLTLKQKP